MPEIIDWLTREDEKPRVVSEITIDDGMIEDATRDNVNLKLEICRLAEHTLRNNPGLSVKHTEDKTALPWAMKFETAKKVAGFICESCSECEGRNPEVLFSLDPDFERATFETSTDGEGNPPPFCMKKDATYEDFLLEDPTLSGQAVWSGKKPTPVTLIMKSTFTGFTCNGPESARPKIEAILEEAVETPVQIKSVR